MLFCCENHAALSEACGTLLPPPFFPFLPELFVEVSFASQAASVDLPGTGGCNHRSEICNQMGLASAEATRPVVVCRRKQSRGPCPRMQVCRRSGHLPLLQQPRVQSCRPTRPDRAVLPVPAISFTSTQGRWCVQVKLSKRPPKAAPFLICGGPCPLRLHSEPGTN